MPRLSWSGDLPPGLAALTPATATPGFGLDLSSSLTLAQSTRQLPCVMLMWRDLWTSGPLSPGGWSGPAPRPSTPVLSVCLPVSLTLSVSCVSLCPSVLFSLSCSLSHYGCMNVSPELSDGSVITRVPSRLFPLPPLLISL